MADFASVFLSLFLSAEVSEITGNRFDELFDDLYKNIDTSFKGNRKDLRDAVERIVGAGYYFALYYCAAECKSKAANPNDVAKFQEIEGIIDEKQKSGSKEMISLFENAPVSQLVKESSKETVGNISNMLLQAGFGGFNLPDNFAESVDKNLFNKMKGYFVNELRTNEQIKYFLHSIVTNELDESMPQIDNSLEMMLSPKNGSLDRVFDKKIKMINKFVYLFGESPLNQVLKLKIDDLPADMTRLYSKWKSSQGALRQANPDESAEDDDIKCFPLAVNRFSEEGKTEFIVADDIGVLRLFFVIRANETPFYPYPVRLEPFEQEIKDDKIHRSYAVENGFKVDDHFYIASVVLNTDYAVLQVLRANRGMYIEKFSDNRILEYIGGNELVGISRAGGRLAQKDVEPERDVIENEIYIDMSNPHGIFALLEVKERRLINPKVKYDFEIGAEYGVLSVKNNGIYLALQLDCDDSKGQTDAFDFYKSISVESQKQSPECDAPVRFAGIIKTRLDKLYSLYHTEPYKPDLLRYFQELFRWTTLSASSKMLEQEINRFIKILRQNIKEQKDEDIILGLFDLQACAIFNKSNIYKGSGDYEKAAALCRKSIEIISSILEIQPDFPIKRPLSFFEGSLNQLLQSSDV